MKCSQPRVNINNFVWIESKTSVVCLYSSGNFSIRGDSVLFLKLRDITWPKTSEVGVTKSQKTLEIASAPGGKTAGIAALFRGFFRGRKSLVQVFFAIAVADLVCFRTRCFSSNVLICRHQTMTCRNSDMFRKRKENPV
jgi:hypothetical protein